MLKLFEICHVDIERRELHYGDNALLFAAYYGSLQTFQYLYEECRSSFLIKNNLGITPLMYACEQGKAEIVTYILQQVNLLIDNHTLSLIQAREYVNSRVYNGGITALLYSVLINRIDLIRLLGDCVYCDVNVSTVDGKTPLIYATQFRRVDIVKYLAEEHAQTDMYAQVVSGEDVLAFIGRETATEEPEEDEEILIKRKQEEDEIRRIILAARSTRVPVSRLSDSSAETIRTLREEVERLTKRERELEDEVETWRNRCEVLLSKDSLLGQQDEEVRAWKRKREEEQVKLCVACCSHERNTVYIPCGHMVMCVSCNEMEHRQHLINSSNSHSSGGIGERVCCVCRTRVTSVRQVYC